MNGLRNISLGLIAALALTVTGVGCSAHRAEGGLGSVELAVLDGSGGWFRLRIYDGPADEALGGDVVFDTGCVEAISRTYELTNIPVGVDRSVVFEGFTGARCAAESRIELGYRGGVTISQTERPYYHIPIYVSDAVTALPEDLNLSAAVATSIKFCDSEDDCGTGGAVCYDAAHPDYWCVPTCLADADCATIHPAATCDQATGWCMLRSPYPLNLSEPRALGAAATLSDGSVAFFGGYGAVDTGRLIHTRHLVEVFDQASGLFVAADSSGVTDWAGGLFGFAELGGDRFALVGGVEGLALSWDAEHQTLSTKGTDWTAAVSDQIVIVDVGAGRAVASPLARPLAQPTVAYLGGGQLLIAGGFGTVANTAQRDAWICQVGDDLGVTCVAIAPLDVARAGAAATCLDAGCERVLLVGGAEGGALAEVLDRSGEQPVFRPLDTTGLQAPVWDPVLCGMDLVAGSDQRAKVGGLLGYHLTVDGDALDASPIDGATASYFGALARAGDGRCFIGGGLGEDGAGVSAVWRAGGGELVTPDGWSLTRGRFGAAGAVVGAGPLRGVALFGGGATVVDQATGTVELVRGVEVLNP